MDYWSKAKEPRDQLVLFPHRLDEAIGPDHRVRVVDEIMRRLDWSKWEATYDGKRGQPAIHPRILASVILYGLLVRIRSSRALEEALQVRLDFRWLVEGRSIDHTTISEFRRKHPEALKDLFVQLGLIARSMGCLPLQTLAFDGTRMRANNNRHAARTPQQLREMKAELAGKFQELEAKVSDADHADDERFGTETAHSVSEELADVERRQRKVDAALAELEQIEREGKKEPKKLPVTDPQSRIMPNKEGGFAANLTPTVTVDADSGFVVGADVLNDLNEDHMLVPSVKEVQEQFGLDQPPAELLADGLMANGENLAACDAEGIDLYSPLKSDDITDNPAIRDDPSLPVASELHDKLPTVTVRRQGKKSKQLAKAAFIYDEASDRYWCPAGNRLDYKNTTTEKTKRGGTRVRRRYLASPEQCATCALFSQCVGGKAKSRMVIREQHEALREAHAKKMATDDAKAKYARRAAVNERPFAAIKQHFGVRQFLLRGLAAVKQEWNWMASAFNIRFLLGHIKGGIGPPSSKS